MASSSEQPSRSFFPSDLQTDGNDRIFSMTDSAGAGFSQLGRWPETICTSTQDPKCDFVGAAKADVTRPIRAEPILGKCETSASEDCIQSVEISRNNGSFTALRFLRYQPARPDNTDGLPFPSDYSKNLPEGIHPSIWEEVVDGVASELKYYVYYQYSMFYDPNQSRFVLQDVRIAIRPVKIETPRWSALWYDTATAGIQYDFPAQTRFRIALRMTDEANGWFKARLNLPEISLKKFSQRNNLVEITGLPVTVPTFAFSRRVDQLTEEEKRFKQMNKGVVGIEPGTPEIFDYIEFVRPIVNDTAGYSNQYWTVNSTNWQSNDKCLNDSTRVVGIVSTNSMGFEGTAPQFKEGFLSYRVTGLHYGQDGKTPNRGSYDLLIRSDAARCLYGFSNAPVSAIVTVTGVDGDQNVASTIVAESQGWLRLSATGFTFSEKKINIKFSQKKSKKVTCSRSGTTKLFNTATCPKGWKRAK